MTRFGDGNRSAAQYGWPYIVSRLCWPSTSWRIPVTMRVMMLAQHFAPEEISGAVLATELADDLVRRGHRVTFVTPAPSYPKGEVFSGFRNGLRTTQFHSDIRVVRVWSYISPKKDFWSRIMNYGTFSAMAFLGGIGRWRPDVIFSYSPPLPLGISAWLLSLWWRVPWVLRVEDLYPDAAIAAGILKNRRAIRLLTWLESFLYRRANHISLISEGFRTNLLAKGQPPAKLSVTPVWVDPEEIRPMSKENGFRRLHGLTDKFVVLYAGNMGITASLDELIEAADLLRDYDNIVFLLVGEGVRKNSLTQEATKRGLHNMRFLDYQPRAVLPEMLAAADVGLVTLNPASSPYSLPSKTFAVMASGRPVLVVAPLGSEISGLVRVARCGTCVEPDSARDLADVILSMGTDPTTSAEMGLRGRRYLESEFSLQVCVDLLEGHLTRAAHGR